MEGWRRGVNNEYFLWAEAITFPNLDAIKLEDKKRKNYLKDFITQADKGVIMEFGRHWNRVAQSVEV